MVLFPLVSAINTPRTRHHLLTLTSRFLVPAKERGIDLDEEDDEESSSEDEDGDLLTSKTQSDILHTIHAIRNKDPKIYDAGHKFFDSDGGCRPCATLVVAG